MAFSTLNLKHPKYDVIKKAPVGFSWTVLFFGFFPPIVRGDISWGMIMLVAWIFTGTLSSFVFMFIYNKIYVKSLLDDGYSSFDSDEVLASIEARLNMQIPRVEGSVRDELNKKALKERKSYDEMSPEEKKIRDIWS